MAAGAVAAKRVSCENAARFWQRGTRDALALSRCQWISPGVDNVCSMCAPSRGLSIWRFCSGLRWRGRPGATGAGLCRAHCGTDRSDNDRQADKRRDPILLLTFADVRPGMKVLDMGAGGAYSTELLARAVAP